MQIMKIMKTMLNVLGEVLKTLIISVIASLLVEAIMPHIPYIMDITSLGWEYVRGDFLPRNIMNITSQLVEYKFVIFEKFIHLKLILMKCKPLAEDLVVYAKLIYYTLSSVAQFLKIWGK